MSIDISSERLITLEEAAALLPGRAPGTTIHPFTISLYTTRGKKGHKLETLLAGPRRVTSIEAVQRFLEAISQSPQRTGGKKAVAMARTAKQRIKAAKAACARMEQAGA